MEAYSRNPTPDKKSYALKKFQIIVIDILGVYISIKYVIEIQKMVVMCDLTHIHNQSQILVC